jgi:beta-glucanase (GH16 family)
MCNRKLLILTIFSLLIFSCSSSDENSDQVTFGKPEINDTSVRTNDVNSEDYWSNTRLVWSDEFDGNELDMEYWIAETSLAGVGYPGWQDYTANDNVVVSNGTLKIIAKKTGEGQKAGDYTSARLNSTSAFTYGKLEIRAKMPKENGSGFWSKLFLLGNNIGVVGYPKCGQVSLIEYISHVPNQFFNTVHTANNVLTGTKIAANSGFVSLETTEEEFHLYGILWTDKYLKFYVDDIENVAYEFSLPSSPNENNWPFTKSFYFVLDTAVGNEFTDGNGVNDAIFPSTLEIDYVRVYHAE